MGLALASGRAGSRPHTRVRNTGAASITGSASPGRAGPAPGGRSTRPGRPPVPVDVPLKTIFIAVLEEHQKQNKTIFGAPQLYAAPCGAVGKAGSSPRPWLLAPGDWRFRMGLGFPLGGGLARGGGRDGVGLGRPAGRQGAGGRAERRGAGVCAPGEQSPHAGNQLGTEQALDQCCLLSGGPGGREAPRRCLWGSLTHPLRESAVLNQELTVRMRLVALASKF